MMSNNFLKKASVCEQSLIDDMTVDVMAQLTVVVKNYKLYRESLWQLSSYGVADEYVVSANNGFNRYNRLDCTVHSFDSVVKAFYHKWLKTIVTNFNVCASNITSERINVNDLPSEILVLKGEISNNINELSKDKGVIVSELLSKIKFLEILRALTPLAAGLENKGLVSASNNLLSEFSFVKYHKDNHTAIVKAQKGKLIVECSYSGDTYERKNQLSSVIDSIRVFEKESGSSGLSDCFEDLLKLENDVSSFSCLESRTSTCKKKDSYIVVYHGKYKLHIKPIVFEQLISFLTEYKGEKELKEIIVK